MVWVFFVLNQHVHFANIILIRQIIDYFHVQARPESSNVAKSFNILFLLFFNKMAEHYGNECKYLC